MDHGCPPVLRLAEDLRPPVTPVTLMGWRGLIHATGSWGWLLRQIPRAPMAAWVATPRGPIPSAERGPARAALALALRAGPLPIRARLIRRFVVESQEEARALARAGVAMGRIACAQGEEVRRVYLEVWRMAGGEGN